MNYGNKFKRILLMFFLVIGTAAISILLYSIYIGIEVKYVPTKYEAEKLASTNNVLNKETHIEETLEEITRSVVGISKMDKIGNSVFVDGATEKLGIGTGVIVSENGYILTNYHVSGEKYTNCYVTLENGKSYNGDVIWDDKDIDLAIIKINMKNLPYINLGDSDNIKLGMNVYAIGNPVGYEFQRTVTAGIISGVNRTIKLETEEVYMEDLIQTDASINPGNSGGPLIDTDGNMIGVTSVKITSADGIGFAVPINIVKPIIEKLLKNGKFDEPYLGIYGYDENVIPYLEKDIDFSGGIYVASIDATGPLKDSKIKTGDIITKLDEYEIKTMSQLKRYIYMKNEGEEISISVKRENETFIEKIKLGKKP